MSSFSIFAFLGEQLFAEGINTILGNVKKYKEYYKIYRMIFSEKIFMDIPIEETFIKDYFTVWFRKPENYHVFFEHFLKADEVKSDSHIYTVLSQSWQEYGKSFQKLNSENIKIGNKIIEKIIMDLRQYFDDYLSLDHIVLINKVTQLILENQKENELQDISKKFFTISLLLEENLSLLETYGPKGKIERNYPSLEAAQYWNTARIDIIIPNNKRIVNYLDSLIQSGYEFPLVELKTIKLFKQHVHQFSVNRVDSILDDTIYIRFPDSFNNIVEKYVKS